MSRLSVDEQEEFDERIAGWIADRVAAEDISFGSLVRELPGVDPTAVAAVLQNLAARAGPASEAARELIQACAMTPATAAATIERPVPHPLDFYWAFTNGSSELLLGELAAATQQGSLIAYLGTPNLFRSAIERLTDRDHVLLDRSVRRTGALRSQGARIVRLDLLRDDLPLLGADAAVLDPPWYPDHMRGFLWAAAQVARSGATIWATAPPPGTRPRSVAEVADVLQRAERHGLAVLQQRPGAIRYLSPPFELASHRAAGLGGIPRDWRMGDLVCLRRTDANTSDRPEPPDGHGTWLPVTIDEIPVCVRDRRVNIERIDSPLLESIIAGDVLGSVSSRDPIRERTDVWTSLNRVWASPYPLGVQAICNALADQVDPAQAVEADLQRPLSAAERGYVRRAVDDLLEIVARERREHRL